MDLKITAMSDTHNHHHAFKLDGGDILIHSGDATGRGSAHEAEQFLDWFKDQDYSHLIFVPGNHDFIFENASEKMKEECDKRGIILLNDSGVTIEGIKIWGSPVQPWFYDWAFNRARGAEIKEHWDLIPEDTEILVTHGPAYGILDQCPNGSVGCQDLLDRILALDAIKLHICGHIHESRGFTKTNGKLFVNASNLDGNYKIQTRHSVSILKDAASGVYDLTK